MANMLVGALASRGYETVDINTTDSRVYMIGRVRGDITNLMSSVKMLYAVAENQPWSVDFSKAFLLRNGELVHAYRFIFQCRGALKEHLRSILGAIANAPQMEASQEVGRVPLHGASASRNAPTEYGGKGAMPAGKFVPKAAMVRMGGG